MPRGSLQHIAAVQRLVFRWFLQNQRDLPWRRTKDPYQILVSEIMLQQTQVDRVIPKYHAFLRRFPTVEILAHATPREVLLVWSGMGYNRRALYLHRLAREVMTRFGGRVPTDLDALRTLPGIGPYTAAAVATFSGDVPHAMADTNVNRVLSRVFFGNTRLHAASSVERAENRKLYAARSRLRAQKLQRLIQKAMPTKKFFGVAPSLWGHALMDFGALVCKGKPRCEECPLQKFCKAYPTFERGKRKAESGKLKNGRQIPQFALSSQLSARAIPDRIYRGRIVAALSKADPHPLSFRSLHARASTPSVRVLRRLIEGLVQEGMLEHVRKTSVRLARGS